MIVPKMRGASRGTARDMPLNRSDYDQAARYLQHALELFDGQSFSGKASVFKLVDLAIARLGPGDRKRDEIDAAAEVTVLRDIANKVPRICP
jgi:hypothetical protein